MDIILYSIELIHVYGCNLEYIVKIGCPEILQLPILGTEFLNPGWDPAWYVQFFGQNDTFGWFFNKKQLYTPRGIVVSNLQACSFNNLLTHISIVIYVWYIVNQISKVQLKYHHSQNDMVKSFKSFFCLCTFYLYYNF